MSKDDNREFQTKNVKKDLSNSHPNFSSSKKIRMRYHRIRNQSYDEVRSGKARLEKPILMVACVLKIQMRRGKAR